MNSKKKDCNRDADAEAEWKRNYDAVKQRKYEIAQNDCDYTQWSVPVHHLPHILTSSHTLLSVDFTVHN